MREVEAAKAHRFVLRRSSGSLNRCCPAHEPVPWAQGAVVEKRRGWKGGGRRDDGRRLSDSSRRREPRPRPRRPACVSWLAWDPWWRPWGWTARPPRLRLASTVGAPLGRYRRQARGAGPTPGRPEHGPPGVGPQGVAVSATVSSWNAPSRRALRVPSCCGNYRRRRRTKATTPSRGRTSPYHSPPDTESSVVSDEDLLERLWRRSLNGPSASSTRRRKPTSRGRRSRATMVQPAALGDRRATYCEVCLLAYDDRALAEACEAHCRIHPSCDLAIGRRSIGHFDPGHGKVVPRERGPAGPSR